MNHVEFLKIASSGAEIVKFIKLQEDTMKLQQQLYISFLPYISADDKSKMLQNLRRQSVNMKYFPISSERSYPFCDRVAPQTGFPNFIEEVGASTQPRLHFSRGTLSDRPGASFPPEVKIVTLQFLVNTFFFRYRQYQLVNFYS